MRTDVRKEMQGVEDRTAAPIAAEVGNLYTELDNFRTETRDRLTRIDDWLDRDGYMLGGGIKALGSLVAHVTNLDSN